ncbi:MAG: hypothetical protein N2482_03500 [Patescibacteria group bacterium]|nr:hypothetical protein [Patescibacteria group bacterium]
MENKLLKRVKEFEKKNKINIKLDQNFLIDEKILRDFIDICQIKSKERIIEIGAGLGFITEKLILFAKEVIAFEIDKRFESYLKKLSFKAKLIFGDGYKFFCDKKLISNLSKIDKIVGNFPYSKLENFLHPLMKGSWFEGDIYMIGPASFVNTINKNPIFNSYYQAVFIKKIKKDSFYPQPNTISAIIHLQRIKNPEKSKNLKIFIKRFLYEHENWKLKNCLREAIIEINKKIKNKFITKNQAREIIKKLKISQDDLEKTGYQTNLKLYQDIAQKLFLVL